MKFDTTRFAANYRALKANQPPIHLPMPTPPVPSFDYSPTPNELALELALIRGSLRIHPTFHDRDAFVSLLTPIQQAVYVRMRGSR